jgi:hypothetical protein
MSAKPAPSTAGVGFGVAQTISPRAPRGLIGLEGVMQTPEEVLGRVPWSGVKPEVCDLIAAL